MQTFTTPINRTTAIKVLQRISKPIVKSSTLSNLGYQEITIGGENGTPLTITLKYDGTWEASTPFELGD